jgi:hypothetical protein
MSTLIRMTCPNCFLTQELTPTEAEVGMICPRCRGRPLRQRVKARRGREVVKLRPSTVRFLAGGGLSLIIGPVLLAIGIPNLGDRAAVLWARLVAIGALFVLIGIGGLIAGFVGLYRDLK